MNCIFQDYMTFLFGKETHTDDGGWQPEEPRIKLTPGIEQSIRTSGVQVGVVPEKEADDLLTVSYGGSNLKQIVLPTTGHESLFAQRDTFTDQREFAGEQHIWVTNNGPVLHVYPPGENPQERQTVWFVADSDNVITPSPLSAPAF